MFIGAAFAELGRKSTRRKLRRELGRQGQARQAALAALGECAWQRQVPLSPADRQHVAALGTVDGQAGALAQHLAALQAEAARLEAQRNAEIARNAHQGVIAELDKALYRLRGEISAKSSASSAAGGQRAAVLAQLGTSLYGQGRREPELQPFIGQIAQIDQAQAATAGQLQGSMAASAAVPKGTMGKFWGAIVLVFVGGMVGIAVATSHSSTPTASTKSELASHASTVDAGVPVKRLDPIPAFSADENVSEAGVQRTIKLYMTEQSVRSEGEEGGKKLIIIVRHDRHVMWLLSPETQTYTEEHFSPDVEPETAPPAALPAGCKVTGHEQVAGYAVARHHCESNLGGAHKIEETRWVADDLGGLVVKAITGTTTVELANIKLGPQDPALFELPTGYHL